MRQCHHGQESDTASRIDLANGIICPPYAGRVTDATGRVLSQFVTRAFGMIQTEILQAKATVTLAVGPMFGLHWLIPRLGLFHSEHSEIDMVVTY